MAARENQGLQFALIIFVVLTILLSVSTFMFFSKLDEERSKIAGFEKATQDAENKAAEYLKDLNDTKVIVGIPPNEKPTKFRDDAMKKDFDLMAAGLADDKQNYRDLSKLLFATLVQKQADIIAAQDREKKLGDKIKTDENTKVGEFKKYTDTVDKVSADYQIERVAMNENVSKAADAKGAAQTKFDAARKNFDQQVTEHKARIQDLESENSKLKQVVARMSEEKLKTEIDVEIADGRVRWVSQGEKIVWVDRGSADGLRQQVSFKVVDRDEPNPANATSKGAVEVIRINDDHTSEARIVSDDPANPIMPGDILFSTAWQPGRVEHFALAGFMDIDSDRVSDREIVKQLILHSRGVIDAEVADNGKRSGEIQVGTKYLILGSPPTDKNMTPEMQKSYTAIIDQAGKLGIKKMPLATFLDYVGYEPQQKTVALDKYARPDDFKATLPEVPRKSAGRTIDFTPIRPKPKPTTY